MDFATAMENEAAQAVQAHVEAAPEPLVDVTVENVIQVTPLQVGQWLVKEVLNIRVPKVGPNNTVNIEADLIPLMPAIANRIAVVTELFVIVVGATPTASYLRSAGSIDTKAASEALSRKKDELYRTLQTLESLRETVSRMMTGMSQIDKLSNRYGQW